MNDVYGRAKIIYIPMPPVAYQPHYYPANNWYATNSANNNIQFSNAYRPNPEHSAKKKYISMDNSLIKYSHSHK